MSNKLVKGVNDLETCFPNLIKEWDYNKNDKFPSQYCAYSTKKVWWKCGKGHSFEAVIQRRTARGKKCPYCSNQKMLIGFNDFGTLCPEIYDWIDNETNELNPKSIKGYHSPLIFALKCKKGHKFYLSAAAFSRGGRCPVCNGKKILVGYNDLNTSHPKLTLRWDFEKNIKFTPYNVSKGSDKKVWWKCEKGHSWKATISSQVAGSSCPICSREYQTSYPEKAIAYTLKKIFNDLEENIKLKELNNRDVDIYIPSLKLAIEYDGSYWHKNFERDLKKDQMCKDNNITMIRVRENGNFQYESNAYVIQVSNKPKNDEIIDIINQVIMLINDKNNLQIDLIDSLNEIKIIESMISKKKEKSVAICKPELIKYWDYEKNGMLKPEMISFGSDKKVWWKCEKGHSRLASVSSLEKEVKCPYCSNKYLMIGYNDLSSRFPKLSKEWDYEKNYPLTPDKVKYTENKKVWWKCAKGHSWNTQIKVRSLMNCGCPICSNKAVEQGTNDLVTLAPDLIKEWDYEKNITLTPLDVSPGSEKKVWWKCELGHSYESMVYSRAVMKTSCPYCKNRKLLVGFNDLETLYPNLAKEWDYKKNNGLLPTQVLGSSGSHKKVWWKCAKGHSWETMIYSRTSQKTNCPYCNLEMRKQERNKIK